MTADDMESLIALISTAIDPLASKSLATRKRDLMEGLRDMIQADAWIWVTGVTNPELAGDSMAFKLLDDGWRSPEERTAFLEASTNPQHTALLFSGLHEALANGRVYTMSRDQLMDDESWHRSAAGTDWRGTGMDHFIISGFPLGQGAYSALGMHRRIGRPAYTERERTLVHLLWKNIEWLHREASGVPAVNKLIDLTPREKQVILLLISGDGRKQVAQKLKLSEHTVADHLKAIYRKFGVVSRSELLSQFIAGS